MANTASYDVNKLRYSVKECLAILGVSRTFFYAQIKAGKYQVTKDGGRTFMTKAQLLSASASDDANGGKDDA